MSAHRAGVALLAFTAALGSSGCKFDYTWFFDVNRTITDLCDIRPEGEFCDPEVLPPVENEGWTVERQEGVVRVYADETVWIATENEEDDAKLTAAKLDVSTVDPGPCTTTRERTLSLTVQFEELTGTLKDSSRTEGGADCGTSPRGARSTAKLDGVQAVSP